MNASELSQKLAAEAASIAAYLLPNGKKGIGRVESREHQWRSR